MNTEDSRGLADHSRDIVVVIILLIIIAVGIFFFYYNKHSGSRVSVKVGGEVIAELELSEPTEYKIDTIYGSNILIIEDGKAYISEADCPDKICVGQGSIEKKGDSIICLPHKLIIEVIR